MIKLITLRKRNKKYQEYSFAYLTISWGDAS